MPRTNIERWIQPFHDDEPIMSSSFWFHRCRAGNKCTYISMKVYPMMKNQNSIVLEGDLFLRCEMEISDTFCYAEQGWNILLKSKMITKTTTVTIPCLRGHKDEIC